MSTTNSDRFALPLLQAGQAQKELTHNEALALVDMLLHAQVESMAVATPPGGAVVGQCWVVATSGTGAWAGQDGKLACLTTGGWRFVAPRKGLQVLNAADGNSYVHDGAAWQMGAVRTNGVYFSGNRIITTRQGAITDPTGGSVTDTQARTAIASILTALRNHGLIA
ncbi:MAG: DUF2793 domain-containing protein [Sphingobium sp.]|jgi:hypothetical protein|nr:DUF2793 domain-containing protein [Sphingobium sp.]MCI1270833.1 DUF2793 domain-containing protein [Sphingobium sp.]MCI1756757.1 DUF2793 domain-containing protein [Sphingobium sp.]MCI2052344.1 DUF2793 domain-containing protein [Sphingobium sp.]